MVARTAAAVAERGPEMVVNDQQAWSRVKATTVPLVLTFHRFGVKRQGSMGEVTVDADKSLLSLSRYLFDSQQYRDIVTHDNQTRDRIKARSVPDPVLGAGVHRIPLQLVTEVVAILETRGTERASLVDAFIRVYPDAVDQGLARLKKLARAKDYPDTTFVRQRFGVTYRFLPDSSEVPDVLRSISRDIFADEQAKARAAVSDAVSEVRGFLRAAFVEIVDRLHERVTDVDGKRRVFRGAMLDGVNEFLATFEHRNVTNDAGLAAIVADLRSTLSGVTVDTLKTSDSFRAHVATKIAEIKSSLDTMVVERRILLPDGD